MSTVHNLEPQPTAKAILHTTSGDLSLELFAQQTPLACRNFLQHCLDGYYTGTIFHRLIPDFILQGGDPSGTGDGGQSSYDGGRPFADEIHPRLKFNRRGLLGMANGGGKDDNGSQFFLTLGKADELNGKHTMFGRVEAGNTIFNLVKMGETDLIEGSERPMYPSKITGAEVLVNPFGDMVKRINVPQAAPKEKLEAKKKQIKKKGGKQLLSFGGADEGDDDAENIAVAPLKTTKFNPSLINAVSDKLDSVKTSQKRTAPPPSKASEPPAKRRFPSRSSSPASPSVQASRQVHPILSTSHARNSSSSSRSPSPPSVEVSAPKPTPLELANAQIAAIKASLKRDVPTADSIRAEKPRSSLESMIPVTATRGRKRKGVGESSGSMAGASREEQRVLEQFTAFRRKLEGASRTSSTSVGIDSGDMLRGKNGANTSKPPTNLVGKYVDNNVPAISDSRTNLATTDDEEANLCDLHFIANCQSCKKWEEDHDKLSSNTESPGGGKGGGDDGEQDVKGWMGRHQLSFAKDRLGKDLEWKRSNEKELVVIDPREREKQLGIGKERKNNTTGRVRQKLDAR